jgi:hypothetical protein
VNIPARVAAAALLFLTVSCGASAPGPVTSTDSADPGDIPDNQAFVPFTSADGLFTVSVPEGWARRPDGSATVFSDKLNSVRIEEISAATPPDASEIPTLSATVPGFKDGKATTVERKAGSVLEITYGATSAADPVTGKTAAQSVERYEYWRAGKTAVVTLAGAVGADNVDPWHTITDSFQWKQ